MSDRRSEKKPKVRRSLGPAFTGMTCPTCGEPYLDALLDVNGVAYTKCGFCSFRALGMSLRQVAAIKFFGELLRSAPVRDGWNKAILATLAETVSPPTTSPTTPAPKEVMHGDAA